MQATSADPPTRIILYFHAADTGCTRETFQTCISWNVFIFVSILYCRKTLTDISSKSMSDMTRVYRVRKLYNFGYLF